MMAVALVVATSLLLTTRAQSQPNPVPSAGCGQFSSGSGTFTIAHGGYTRTYIVYQPANYEQSTPIPFVFAFHGYTNTAQGMKNAWDGDASADEKNYLSVYVQSTNGANRNSWNDIGCAGSPGPQGPTCNYSTVRDVPIPNDCPRDEGPENGDGYCNWCNCDADDVGFIDYLAGTHFLHIEYQMSCFDCSGIIEQNYCIDVSREYALGFSQGGMMAHTVGCQLNGRFAAIAPCL